jgi:outer membrane immunogenic protein
MRCIVLSAVSVIALVSSALAADIYPGGASYKDTPVLLPAATWTGFYLGVNGGFGGFDSLKFRDDTFVTATGANLSRVTGKTNIAGGFGGGQLGYNLQSGGFVYGFETDIQGSGIRGHGGAFQLVANPAPPPALIGRSAAAKVDIDYFGTVRGRVGYSFGGTLLYATGGFAYGGVNSTFAFEDTVGAIGDNGRVSHNKTATGWVAGAGVEYKIAPNWSLKGEYQFIDLGSESVTGPLILPVGSSLRGSEKNIELNTVRVGVNYYFNTPYEPLPLK